MKPGKPFSGSRIRHFQPPPGPCMPFSSSPHWPHLEASITMSIKRTLISSLSSPAQRIFQKSISTNIFPAPTNPQLRCFIKSTIPSSSARL